MTTTHSAERIALRRVPRRRGAVSGLLLFVLGVWGALAPFIGPYFDYGYSPQQTWTWTAGRGWFEVLPGGVTAVAGLILLAAVSRAGAMCGAWLAVAAGAWFVVGPTLAGPLNLDIGAPVSDHESVRVLETLGLFLALGVLIVLIAAVAVGRLSMRSIGDVRSAERTVLAEQEAEELARRDREAVVTPAEADVPLASRSEVQADNRMTTTRAMEPVNDGEDGSRVVERPVDGSRVVDRPVDEVQADGSRAVDPRLDDGVDTVAASGQHHRRSWSRH